MHTRKISSRINFFTEDIKFILRNKNYLRLWIETVLGKEGCNSAVLNYIFCSASFLHRLNKKFLHHDEDTDIITFDLSFPKSFPDNVKGEIFISVEMVKENAKLFKTGFQNELHRVMIHGVLHLAGYNDKTKSAQAVMREKEDYYLSLRSF